MSEGPPKFENKPATSEDWSIEQDHQKMLEENLKIKSFEGRGGLYEVLEKRTGATNSRGEFQSAVELKNIIEGIRKKELDPISVTNSDSSGKLRETVLRLREEGSQMQEKQAA
jgi:hypothetical protein